MSFFRKHGERARTYKAVFSVTIDFSEYGEYSNTHLVAGEKYPLGNKATRVSYDDIKEFAVSVLNNELHNECKQFIDIPIHSIEVKGIYEGSIELFLTVIFGVVAGITGIKDLYDSIDFLRVLIKKKLEKRFRETYGDNFRIDLHRQIPRDTHCYDTHYFHKQHTVPVAFSNSNERPIRDAFFYYLIVSNIVLFAIIVVLVANAVIKIYL